MSENVICQSKILVGKYQCQLKFGVKCHTLHTWSKSDVFVLSNESHHGLYVK